MDDKYILPNEVIWILLVVLGILSVAIFVAFLLSFVLPDTIAEVLIALGTLYCGVAATGIIYILVFILKELQKNII